MNKFAVELAQHTSEQSKHLRQLHNGYNNNELAAMANSAHQL